MKFFGYDGFKFGGSDVCVGLVCLLGCILFLLFFMGFLVFIVDVDVVMSEVFILYDVIGFASVFIKMLLIFFVIDVCVLFFLRVILNVCVYVLVFCLMFLLIGVKLRVIMRLKYRAYYFVLSENFFCCVLFNMYWDVVIFVVCILFCVF